MRLYILLKLDFLAAVLEIDFIVTVISFTSIASCYTEGGFQKTLERQFQLSSC